MASVGVAAMFASFLVGRGTAPAPGDGSTPDLPDAAPGVTSLDQVRSSYGYRGWPTLGNRSNDRAQAREALGILVDHGTSPGTKVRALGGAYPTDVDSPDDVEHSRLLFSGTVTDGGHRKDLYSPGKPEGPRPGWVSLMTSNRYLLMYNPVRNGNGTVLTAPPHPSMGARPTGEGPPVSLVWDAPDDPYYSYSSGDVTLVMPPWLTNLRFSSLGNVPAGGDPLAWHPAKTQEGGTATVPPQVEIDPSSGEEKDEGPRNPHDGCGEAVLLRADDRSGPDGVRQVTYLYKPGFPYPIELTYYPTPEAARKGQHDVAALDRLHIRYAAGALLCDEAISGGDIPVEVTWRELWQGETGGDEGRRKTVLSEDLTLITGRRASSTLHTVVAVDTDVQMDVRYPDYRVLTGSQDVTAASRSTNDSRPRRTRDVACLPDGDRVRVIGPKNAREIRLFDPASGRVRSTAGNTATFPKDGLPQRLSDLQAIAVTGGNEQPQSAPCGVPPES
nr:hypothetical protein GCM10010200_026970 [Actinomadura rugatobispora]